METFEIDVSKFLSIPFKEKGRDYTGCDCWGISYLIYRDVRGIELPLYLDGYHNSSDAEEIGKIVRNEKSLWDRVSPPAPFDLVNIRMLGEPMHIGVCIGMGKFIHCSSKIGVTKESLNSFKWESRILGYYRYRE